MKILVILLLIFLNTPTLAEEKRPLFSLRADLSLVEEEKGYHPNSVRGSYLSGINFYDGTISLWGTKWYKKFILGFGMGLINTGFYDFHHSARLGFGLKIEMPLSIILLNKYEVAEDFEGHFIESENEKGFHLSPNLGINILYLQLLKSGIETFNNSGINYIYNNNLNPTILLQPYFMLSVKNKNIEYLSFTVKYAIGFVNAEKLQEFDPIQLTSRQYYTANSYLEIGISKSINIYGSLSSYPKKRKMGGKYNGTCPD